MALVKSYYWLVGWFYRRPHTSYSLLGVVQLPTDVRIYGDTHSSVLRVFREYFYYLPPDNDVQCCHLVSPPGKADLLCNDQRHNWCAHYSTAS